MRVSQSAAYFDRRVTCIEWHPFPGFEDVVALGSYVPGAGNGGGSARNGDDDEDESVPFLYGRGKGGSITSMKFHPTEPNMIFTTSIDGTVRKQDFEGRHGRVFLDTLTHNRWYTALNVSSSRRSLVVGDNTGQMILSDFDGVTAWSGRLHKNKIHDVEFHPADEFVLATAGNDRVAKLWDVRMMREGQDGVQPLKVLEHDGVITSATFSPFPPYTLLTTAQNSENRLYDISLPTTHLTATTTLPHPHRPFQHITPITASWSPVIPGLFVIGRYPESATDRRTVDVFQYVAGGSAGGVRLVARLEDPKVAGIHCIAKFDRQGDTLATCS
ncbi:DNA damage-binding protein 2, partial [Borealophlyctis nickersoniae]